MPQVGPAIIINNNNAKVSCPEPSSVGAYTASDGDKALRVR